MCGCESLLIDVIGGKGDVIPRVEISRGDSESETRSFHQFIDGGSDFAAAWDR